MNQPESRGHYRLGQPDARSEEARSNDERIKDFLDESPDPEIISVEDLVKQFPMRPADGRAYVKTALATIESESGKLLEIARSCMNIAPGDLQEVLDALPNSEAWLNQLIPTEHVITEEVSEAKAHALLKRANHLVDFKNVLLRADQVFARSVDDQTSDAGADAIRLAADLSAKRMTEIAPLTKKSADEEAA